MRIWLAILTFCIGVGFLATAQAAEPRVVAHVSIATQTMTVSVDNRVMYSWSVSTARPGKVTPRGTYTPYWLHANHYSSLYHNAPMPHSIFFNGNYAVHGTTEEHTLGERVSAGCVRLSRDNARTLYRLVEQYGMSATRIIVQ